MTFDNDQGSAPRLDQAWNLEPPFDQWRRSIFHFPPSIYGRQDDFFPTPRVNDDDVREHQTPNPEYPRYTTLVYIIFCSSVSPPTSCTRLQPRSKLITNEKFPSLRTFRTEFHQSPSLIRRKPTSQTASIATWSLFSTRRVAQPSALIMPSQTPTSFASAAAGGMSQDWNARGSGRADASGAMDW